MPVSSTSCMLRVLFLHTAGTRSMFPCYPEEEKPMVSGRDQHVSLPPHYAFVVQLATDTEIDTGQLHGRCQRWCSIASRHGRRRRDGHGQAQPMSGPCSATGIAQAARRAQREAETLH
jgi:hypothetical protein